MPVWGGPSRSRVANLGYSAPPSAPVQQSTRASAPGSGPSPMLDGLGVVEHVERVPLGLDRLQCGIAALVVEGGPAGGQVHIGVVDEAAVGDAVGCRDAAGGRVHAAVEA